MESTVSLPLPECNNFDPVEIRQSVTMDAEAKEIPHMVIKKVHKSSQGHMEEFVKQFGAER